MRRQFFDEETVDQRTLTEGDDVVALGQGAVNAVSLAGERKNGVPSAVNLKEVGMVIESGPGAGLKAGPSDEMGVGVAKHLQHVSADRAKEGRGSGESLEVPEGQVARGGGECAKERVDVVTLGAAGDEDQFADGQVLGDFGGDHATE